MTKLIRMYINSGYDPCPLFESYCEYMHPFQFWTRNPFYLRTEVYLQMLMNSFGFWISQPVSNRTNPLQPRVSLKPVWNRKINKTQLASPWHRPLFIYLFLFYFFLPKTYHAKLSILAFLVNSRPLFGDV